MSKGQRKKPSPKGKGKYNSKKKLSKALKYRKKICDPGAIAALKAALKIAKGPRRSTKGRKRSAESIAKAKATRERNLAAAAAGYVP